MPRVALLIVAQILVLIRAGPTVTLLHWDRTSRMGTRPGTINLPQGTCIVQRDNTTVQSSQVVVFDWHGLDSIPAEKDRKRPPNAIWLYLNTESPAYKGNRHEEYMEALDGQFNAMLTHQRVSAGPLDYHGKITPRTTPLESLDLYFAERSKLAVVLMSNCKSVDRTIKLEELSKHLDFDIMGRCGTTPVIPDCQRSAVSNDPQPTNCFPALSHIYKFYLSFENSDCTDYITEKVWQNAFNSNMIPIVWGTHANYEINLPHRSFINVAAFPSLTDFAQHVHAVSTDEALFNSYHAWKYQYSVTKGSLWSKLCSFVLDHAASPPEPLDVKALRDVNTQCSRKQDRRFSGGSFEDQF